MEIFKLSPDGRYMALQGSSRKGGGVVNILDAQTLQWVAQARVESRDGVVDFAWWRDGRGLCVAGKNGEVTEWSLEVGRAVGRWVDEGAVGTTTIALGGRSGRDEYLGGDRWVAVGSSAGVVNIYDRRAWAAAATSPTTIHSREQVGNGNVHGPTTGDNNGVPPRPTPTKALDNLTTPISHLTFSPDGQILLMASRWKQDALRLVHLPTCTVFKNWPTQKTPLGRISSVAFGVGASSPPLQDEEKEGKDGGGGGELWLAVGSEQGRVRLWEIRS